MKTIVQHFNEKWPGVEWRVMFHGTSQSFEEFDESLSIGRGRDENSSLGIHFAEFPDDAGEYAQVSHERGEGATATVLAVVMAAHDPYLETDYYRFFGFNEEGDPDPDFGKRGFSQWRQELLAESYDVVDYEDGEGCITVALNPADLFIVGRMDAAKAMELGETIRNLDDCFDPIQRIEAMEEAGVTLEIAAAPEAKARKGPGL